MAGGGADDLGEWMEKGEAWCRGHMGYGARERMCAPGNVTSRLRA